MAYPNREQIKRKKIKSKLKMIAIVLILVGVVVVLVGGGSHIPPEMKAKASATDIKLNDWDNSKDKGTDVTIEKKGDSISLRWGESTE